MSDLDTLRPEIRDAVDSLDKSEGIDFAWLAVRAEMLRLARESDEWQTRCLRFQTERDMARAELAALKARSFHPRAQLLTNLATANERAERAEAELAALKARRDGSRHVFLRPNMDRITFLADEIGPNGKYALVKVEE